MPISTVIQTERPDKAVQARRIGFALLCVAVVVYAVLLSRAAVRTGSVFSGEAASYTLTTVSLAHDGNAFVSEQDLAAARAWLPEWAEFYETFGGSHYTTPQGTVPWYFPTYPAACLPLFWLLGLLGLPREYAFCLTNLVLFLAVQAAVLADRRLTLGQKAPLCLLLGIHPAVFYISWPSAEVFQFVCIALSALCWATGRRCRAALLIAVAGTTNPCILAIGLAMIAEYLVGLWRQGTGKPAARLIGMAARWKEVLLYAVCYLPGLVPFAYNYAICGAINLTASYKGEWIPLNDLTLLRHLWAYFTDWNFGILPYMPVLLVIWAVFLVLAVVRRCARYLWMNLGFLGALLGVSLMANINHGMSGISRYLAWATALMVVSVGTQAPRLVRGLRARQVLAVAMVGSAVYTGGVICAYGGIQAPLTDGGRITPLAEKLLGYFPSLYDPLPVVLQDRSNTEPWLPAGWTDDAMNLRKLYLDESQAAMVREAVGSQSAEDLAWLDARLDELGPEKSILTIPTRRHIYLAHWNCSVANGFLYVSSGEVSGDTLTTTPQAGYPFWTNVNRFAAGSYHAELDAACLEMPGDAPAQFQAAVDNGNGLEILASVPLAADGSAALDVELPAGMQNLSFRVYQNEGTVLQVRSVAIDRLA